MKASKIIRTWGAIAAALALSISAQAYQGMTTPKLHINGRNLQDTSGKNVRLFGYMLPTDGAGSGGLFNNPTTFQPADVATCLDVWKKEAELLTHTGPLLARATAGITVSYAYGLLRTVGPIVARAIPPCKIGRGTTSISLTSNTASQSDSMWSLSGIAHPDPAVL